MRILLLVCILLAYTITRAQLTTKNFQGQWTCVEMTEDGKELPAESFNFVTLTVFNDNYRVFMGDFVVPFKLNVMASNKLTLAALSGLNKGKVYTASYQFNGNNEFTLSYGADKPSLEKSTPKSGRIMKWKRIPLNNQGMQASSVVNSLKMKFRLILPGSFVMGASPEEDGRQDELQHRVTISKPYYIAETEVTVAQFRQFIQESGRAQNLAVASTSGVYKTEAEQGNLLTLENAKGGVSTARNGINSWDSAANWRTPGFTQNTQHPVVFVSWNDANEFCKWLSQKEGKTYRLPTEAEWEFAARGNTTTQYWWGNDINNNKRGANLADATYAKRFPNRNFGIVSADNFVFTSPVGSFTPNPNGLYDVTGNVFEWVSDYWAPFANDPLVNPKGPEYGRFRVAKGGGWASSPNDCRIAFRYRESPDLRFAGTGFRVALEIE